MVDSDNMDVRDMILDNVTGSRSKESSDVPMSEDETEDSSKIFPPKIDEKVPLVDGNGRPIIGEDSKVIYDEVVDPEDLDLTAEDEYNEKSAFLSDNFRTGFPDMTEIYLRDFLEMIFVRYGDEPFEEKEAHNYQVYRRQVDAGVPLDQIDYSKCDDRRKWNAIVLTRRMRNTSRGGMKSYDRCEQRLLLKDDWNSIDWLESRYFALMAPLTYKGKSTKADNARMLFAFGVDLDDVGMEQLECLFLFLNRRWSSSSHPIKGQPIIMPPNIIVNSGHGLHLYYILEHPIPLGKYADKNNALLKWISDRLYEESWYPYNEKTGEPGTSKKKVSYLGIYHPFRIPGTLTKPLRYNKAKQRATGKGLPIRAWSLGIPYYRMSDFVDRWGWDKGFSEQFTPDVISKLESGDRILDPKHMTREEAMAAYPDWNPDAEEKGHYVINRRLYDSWLTKMRKPQVSGVKEGHRYYCIVALTAFAKKCGISFEELSNDAYSLLESFDDIEARSDNRFTANDIKKALSFYYYDKSVRYSRIKLEASTGIPMPKTKRNRRKQRQHLKTARFAQNLDDPEGKWRNRNGRPEADIETSKEANMIKEWINTHPDSKNKSACARDTGLHRHTVRKWWNAIETGVIVRNKKTEKPKRETEEDITRAVNEKIEDLRRLLNDVPVKYLGGISIDELTRVLNDPELRERSNIELMKEKEPGDR